MNRILIALSLALSLASPPAFLSSLWSETGCHLDPNGCPAPRTDEGCHLDPNGGCLTDRSDEGCHLDPDG